MNTLGKGTKGASNATKPSVQTRVVAALHHGNYTRRQLSTVTGIEIATLCGALHALEKAGLINANQTTTCPTTQREVLVYSLKGTE